MLNDIFWSTVHIAIAIAIYLVYIQNRRAFNRIGENDEARAKFLAELRIKTDELATRQERIAQVADAKRADSARALEGNLTTIKTQLAENTKLTVQATEASVAAVDAANHMNEKHETAIAELKNESSADISLKRIDQNTAAIEKNTAKTDAVVAKTAADVQGLKDKK